MKKIGVLGAGSWGTALAILLANNGHDVSLWSKMKDELDMLEEHREHRDRLPGTILPDSIRIERELEPLCTDKDLVVQAVASPFVRGVAGEAAPFVAKGQVIVNVAKGIESHTLMTLSDILKEVLPQSNVAVMSGPSHAEETVKGVPTTVVVGAADEGTAKYIQDIFMNDRFRVYTSPDVIGIELGAALKNVIALAAGVVDGMGYGDNSRAAIITRGIAEISRLGMAMGGKRETFAGLSGVGDLIVTCTSQHSRNHNAGYLIGQGLTAKEAMAKVNQVVEGVYSAEAALELGKKHGVAMPIVEQMNEILFHGKGVDEAVAALLERDKKAESTSLQWL